MATRVNLYERVESTSESDREDLLDLIELLNNELVAEKKRIIDFIEQKHEESEYLNSIPNPLLVVSKDFKVRYLNAAYLKVIGKTSEACIGKKCFEVFSTSHCNTSECLIVRALAQNEEFTGTATIKLPSGIVPIQYTGVPHKDSNGNVVAALKYIHNYDRCLLYTSPSPRDS